MLKFAKYFFIVFLITAILPLVLMFAWNNSQMEKFHNAMAKSAMSTGLMRLEYSVKTNLKVQEGDILRKLYYILPNDKNLSHIKNILNDYNTEVIQKPIKSYFIIRNRRKILIISQFIFHHIASVSS